MDKERIYVKIDEMEQYLKELYAIVPETFEEYRENIVVKRAVERLLQISIESAIDVCVLLVKELKLGLPAEEEDFFERLEEKVLSRKIVEKLKNMKRFRNVLVHGYAKIDDSKVFEILKKRLEDFERFKKEVLKFLKEK